MDAELQVGFSLFNEHYTSRVEMSPHRFVKACATNTPMFRLLRNEWFFSPGPTADSCLVDFLVEYQFHNRWYAQVRLCCCMDARCQVLLYILYRSCALMWSRVPLGVHTPL